MSNNSVANIKTINLIKTPLAMVLVGSVLAGCSTLPKPAYNNGVNNGGVSVKDRRPDVIDPSVGVGNNNYNPPINGNVNTGNANNGNVYPYPNASHKSSKFHDMPVVEGDPQLINRVGNLWSRVSRGYQFSLNRGYNPRVEAEKQFFLNNKRFLIDSARRASHYLYYTVSEAEARGLPTELALLPIIESGYDPTAESDAGAVGLWQIVPNTAGDLGLKIHPSYDARMDVIESTKGAYAYLKQLHNQFGNWELALAAYNGGMGTIAQAIEANKSVGNPTDYWSLNLEDETMRYVPRLLAIADIMANPNRYGLNIPAIANAQYFQEIPVNNGTQLVTVANVTGVPLDELKYINEGLKRDRVDTFTPQRLLVPTSLTSNQLAMITNGQAGGNNYGQGDYINNGNQPVYPAKNYYIVQKGDRLIDLAKRFNIPLSKLASYNNLSRNAKLRKRQKLWLIPGMVDQTSGQYYPQHNANTNNANTNNANTNNGTYYPKQSSYRGVTSKYKIKRGDTLRGIARKLGTNTTVIASLNDFDSNYYVKRGEYIRVPASKTMVDIRLNDKVAHYKVKAGDSLNSVSKKFGLTIGQLASANGLTTNSYLLRGKTILIPNRTFNYGSVSNGSLSSSSVSNNQGINPFPATSKRTFDYRVKAGDSLTNLAKRYDTTVPELAKLNQLSVTSGLRIGQKIKLPKTSMDYKVRSGDGLIMLAKRFGTTTQRLAEMNDLSPMAELRRGQVIQVPLR